MNLKILTAFFRNHPQKDPQPGPANNWISSYGDMNHISVINTFLEKEQVCTIFDIGAHHGDITQEYYDIYPAASIYCFEPSPRSFRTLSDRFSGNPRIKLFNYAVLDKSGTVEFYCNRTSATDSILSPSPEARRWVDGRDAGSLDCTDLTKVESIDLDTFCKQNNIAGIDILKIDTQGAEVHVLRGARNLLGQHKIRLILAELLFVPVYQNQPYFYQVCDLLHSYGYSLVNLFNIRFDDDMLQMKWADGLFVCRGWDRG